MIAGTTGESPSLTIEETEELTRRAVDRCGGKIPLIVGAGTNSTASTVARTRALSRLGVDGVMLVTPYYNKPPQEGLFRHFSAAADASAVPVVLYNVPSRTAVDLQPATVARLARHPRIKALKDASAAMPRLRDLLALCPAGFSVLSGDDATAVEWMGAGAHGVISVTANVVPRRMREASSAALAGDLAAARAIDADLAAPAPRFVRRGEPHSREMGGGTDGPHRERHPVTAGRTVAGSPRDGAARDAGGGRATRGPRSVRHSSRLFY